MYLHGTSICPDYSIDGWIVQSGEGTKNEAGSIIFCAEEDARISRRRKLAGRLFRLFASAGASAALCPSLKKKRCLGCVSKSETGAVSSRFSCHSRIKTYWRYVKGFAGRRLRKFSRHARVGLIQQLLKGRAGWSPGSGQLSQQAPRPLFQGCPAPQRRLHRICCQSSPDVV